MTTRFIFDLTIASVGLKTVFAARAYQCDVTTKTSLS